MTGCAPCNVDLPTAFLAAEQNMKTVLAISANIYNSSSEKLVPSLDATITGRPD